MPKEHPKMSQKVANMAPNWAQVGVMVGSKIVLDVSKGAKNRIPEGIRKKDPKASKNLGLGRPPNGKYEWGGR